MKEVIVTRNFYWRIILGQFVPKGSKILYISYGRNQYHVSTLVPNFSKLYPNHYVYFQRYNVLIRPSITSKQQTTITLSKGTVLVSLDNTIGPLKMDLKVVPVDVWYESHHNDVQYKPRKGVLKISGEEVQQYMEDKPCQAYICKGHRGTNAIYLSPVQRNTVETVVQLAGLTKCTWFSDTYFTEAKQRWCKPCFTMDSIENGFQDVTVYCFE